MSPTLVHINPTIIGFNVNLVAHSTSFTSRYLLTGYVGLILRSTDVATASQSTVEGTMRVRSMRSASQPSVTVASKYPHSTLNSTVTYSSNSSTA